MRWWGCRLRQKYKHITDCLASTATPQSAPPLAPFTQGSQGRRILHLPRCFDCSVNRNRQPLSHANACQLPLHRGAKGIDSTHAVLFY